MSSSTSTWNAGSFAAASASMKAIRLMPAYCAARSCETRPWRYQSIAAARRISFANASGDSAIGARVSRGNSIRMACSACCTLMPCSPHQPRLAGTGRPYDPTRDARRQEAEAVAPGAVTGGLRGLVRSCGVRTRGISAVAIGPARPARPGLPRPIVCCEAGGRRSFTVRPRRAAASRSGTSRNHPAGRDVRASPCGGRGRDSPA